MFRKILCLSLAAVLLSATCLAAPNNEVILMAEAEETVTETGAWTYAGSKITKLTEADGTEHTADLTPWGGTEDVTETFTPASDDYYEIANGADLAAFANLVNGGTTTANARLTSDIDLNGKNWKSFKIGDASANAFAGTFDGQGHTIYNLYCLHDDGTNQGGLFRYITGGTVKNINVENAEIISKYTDSATGESGISVICGVLGTNSKISNISVSGTITVNENCYANHAGSIVAKMSGGTVENCYSDVVFQLSNSGAPSNVVTSTFANYGVGGIVGTMNSTDAVITKCGFEGTINAPNTARVGGIAGGNKKSTGGTITYCYNTGNITGLRQVAGILGWMGNGKASTADLFTNNYNTGNIVTKSADNSHAAGLVNGLGGSYIKYSYSTGDVSVDSTITFNEKCGLLFTNLNTSKITASTHNSSTAVYCNEYTYTDSTGVSVAKHSGSTANTEGSNVGNPGTVYTLAQFKDGTALTTLGTGYADLNGVNNELPVLSWQNTALLTGANTYEVANGNLALTNEAGLVTLKITPVGGSATVSVGGDSKTITAAGTYTFDASANATVAVTGRALIEADLMNQKAGSAAEAIDSAALKVTIPCSENATLIIALYDGSHNLIKAVKSAAVPADGDISGVIDLSNVNVTGCELKAYVWDAADGITPIKKTAELPTLK